MIGAVDPAKPVGQDHLCITARREIATVPMISDRRTL